MLLVSSLVLTGCAPQDYLSPRAQEFIEFLQEHGEDELAVALGDTELHTNPNGGLSASFDIKSVEKNEKKPLNDYDFSGPANSGIASDVAEVGVNVEDALAKGVVYLIPLGIKNNGNGTLAQKSDVIELFNGAWSDSRSFRMSSNCTGAIVKDHKRFNSSKEMKKHVQKLYNDSAEDRLGTSGSLSKEAKELCELTMTGSVYGGSNTSNSNKFFILSDVAIASVGNEGFGMTSGGAKVAGLNQYQINYRIAEETKMKLEALGYTVYLSRATEEDSTVKDFKTYMVDAKNKKADTVILIGTNSKNGDSKLSISYPNKDVAVHADVEASEKLAGAISSAVTSLSISENKAAVYGKERSAVKECSEQNAFINSALPNASVVYCECAAFSSTAYGTISNNVADKMIAGYGEIIATGVSNN